MILLTKAEAARILALFTDANSTTPEDVLWDLDYISRYGSDLLLRPNGAKLGYSKYDESYRMSDYCRGKAEAAMFAALAMTDSEAREYAKEVRKRMWWW